MEEGGGVIVFLSTIVGYAMRGGGGRKKTHQIIGGASKNFEGKHLKSS